MFIGRMCIKMDIPGSTKSSHSSGRMIIPISCWAGVGGGGACGSEFPFDVSPISDPVSVNAEEGIEVAMRS